MSELPFESPDGLPLAPERDPAAVESVLSGEIVVFTGKLWSLGRKEARSTVERLGGTVEEEVTLRTSLIVVGSLTYPDGVPDLSQLTSESGTHRLKLRRAAQLNNEQPGRIRLISENEFCRRIGLPSVDELRGRHYGQRDILVMYPALREDHLRYLQKWGFIRPAFKNNADTFFAFSDLTLLRQVHTEVNQGVPFRGVLRDLQASRSGQLTFDFRIDAQPARILALKPKSPPPASGGLTADLVNGRPLTTAEQYFLMGSLLDDGTPERQDEAAQAYRRALEEDSELVAAIINLANIRYARDELAEAQALYERAILLDPTYFEAHFNLGNIHHDHARYLEAEHCYIEALALNAEYPDAHFYLAVTLEKMGRSTDARPHWRDYQALAPQGEWVELAKEFSD
jgi:tetratricopeptide (TPR) repeat protein